VSEAHLLHTPEQVIERLGGLPGGPELLAVARGHADVALVGGAVRDLLLGHWPRELDVTVARDAAGLAAELAASVSPSERAYGHAVEPILHERFGTASVVWEYGRIDIAERRAEVYPAPGALPEVRPGTVEEDLARRDFTVNAVALPLAGRERGHLQAVEGALEDLASGTLRVLHGRSFADDPTRILRLARYAARLRFAIDSRTRELAKQALATGALDTVSGGRIGSELCLAAGEEDGRAAFRALDSLGVLAALGLPSPFDDGLAETALSWLPADGSRSVLLMAVAFRPPELSERKGVGELAASLFELMSHLDFPASLRETVLTSAVNSTGLAAQIRAAPEPVTAWSVFDSEPVEGMALTGALLARESPEAARPVRQWLDVHRHARLEIDGNDLIAAGVPEGPEIGYRLQATLQRKREGLVSGRQSELDAALAAEIPAPGGAIET
jgi:tRNA nucleotidyltransferase (CCA-adding enzyme)